MYPYKPSFIKLAWHSSYGPFYFYIWSFPRVLILTEEDGCLSRKGDDRCSVWGYVSLLKSFSLSKGNKFLFPWSYHLRNFTVCDRKTWPRAASLTSDSRAPSGHWGGWGSLNSLQVARWPQTSSAPLRHFWCLLCLKQASDGPVAACPPWGPQYPSPFWGGGVPIWHHPPQNATSICSSLFKMLGSLISGPSCSET